MLWIAGLVAFGVSALITGAVRGAALRHGLVDRPNERSSHAVPTPRGGGLSIAVVTTCGVAALWLAGLVDASLAIALIVGGGAVAVIGFLDDRMSLPARVRLLVHLSAAILAVYLLGGLPPIQFGAGLVDLGWIGHALAVITVMWALNFFNFMDGIDGIAASEAIFVAAAGAAITCYTGGSLAAVHVSIVFAAACLGFLVWNWPPARIFMGDVGSGYLGFVLAVVAIAVTREQPTGGWALLTLSGVFFIDATVTLCRRVARGEKASEAHRSHAYQRLARRWASHRRVTFTVLAINLIWLLPWAVVSALCPRWSIWAMLIALAPLCAAAIVVGAGRPEP